MNPLRPEVSAPWRPMWHPNAHPGRPWWRIGPSAWTRCDGVMLHDPALAHMFKLDPRGALLDGESYPDAIARIDAEHPLPAPPPMPGQVWAKHEETRTERHIDGVMVTPDGYVYVVWSGDDPGHMHIARGTLWPPPGAILVAGPTPWGRDVPWSPS